MVRECEKRNFFGSWRLLKATMGVWRGLRVKGEYERNENE